MKYRIFPSIGIARLGEDDNFFLGPEQPGAGPRELMDDGTVTEVTQFKDASRTKIRKQGARFHIFESPDGLNWVPANLPSTAKVTWSVTLENKKSAVNRPTEPPIVPTRPQVPVGNEPLVIKGGTKQISGCDQVSASFTGKYVTTNSDDSPFQVDVELGKLRTDGKGRLIVLGGKGFSNAPEGTSLGQSYYKNPKWHDDVADGPIIAEIQMSQTSAPIRAEGGAWVIIGPPDFAPEIDFVVTLYDVLRQVGINEFGVPLPAIPSFDRDIAPILTRVRRLRWVHNNAAWSSARLENPNLRSKADADRSLREAVRNIVLRAESVFRGHTNSSGPPYRLREFQKEFLEKWVAGNFDNTPIPINESLSAEGLTRASLESAAGQGFCPGIEAGIIVLDKTIYSEPFDFRINHESVKAGDLTALMAQPWQADFLKCHTEWWPVQRPDIAFLNDTTKKAWQRGAGRNNQHNLFLDRLSRLGFIVRQGESEVFLEAERDSSLPETPSP